MSEKILVSTILGDDIEDNFFDFDITEIQEISTSLQNVDAIDLPHAELLSQQTLRCADILSGYLGKLTKIVSWLDSKVSSAKNKASLDYEAPAGRTTAEMRKWAGETSPEVESLQSQLAKAKGGKVFLEKKFDVMIKAHHHYKDLATGLRKTILGYRDV